MKSLKVILMLLSLTTVITAQDLSVYDLTTDHRKDPVGIDNKQPRLSWKIKGIG